MCFSFCCLCRHYRLPFSCRRTIPTEVGVEELTGGRDTSYARIKGSVFIVGIDRANRPANGKTPALVLLQTKKTSLQYVCSELATTG